MPPLQVTIAIAELLMLLEGYLLIDIPTDLTLTKVEIVTGDTLVFTLKKL